VRRDLVAEIGRLTGTTHSGVRVYVSMCLRAIRSEESTAAAVRAIQDDPMNAYHQLDLLRQRVGSRHPGSLTQEQCEAVVGALIRIKMENPDLGDDSLTDVIMHIRDERVLPAFFEMLERHRDHRNVQRQASYSLWIIFRGGLQNETPGAIRDLRDLNKDPMASGELWRRWYATNKDRLVWDGGLRRYRLR